MMGHVLNLLVQCVREIDPEAVPKIFEHAGVEQLEEYRFEEVYPEETFGKLVVSTLEVLDVDVPTLENTFAEFFIRVSPQLFPAIFELSGDARTLLARIPHIHRSIPTAAGSQLFKDKLTVVENDEEHLLLRYDSPHKLCGFLQRLANLTLEYYGNEGEVAELQCSREGHDACLVEVRFTEAA